ncbi:MAG: cysteine desulfurase [Candidatus Hydrothermae bacterium]|nr:cysteine desulfurase [Candidatus Hydrothermae bacterium]
MKVYLDNASTTVTDPRVVDLMLPVFTENYALPTSEFIHTPGQMVKDLVEGSRKSLAEFIGAKSIEIVFTSGGTESINLAIKGAALEHGIRGKHILTTTIENRAVLDSVRFLKRMGFDVEFIPVDREGFLDLEFLDKSVRKNTILVSVQTVNDEVGTIQPIEEIVKIVKEKNPDTLVHTDATYALGWLPFNVESIGVDLASFTAHKLHGPKGIGALYIREGAKIAKIIDGGYAEFNMRGGTPNIPGIIGFKGALELVVSNEVERIRRLRDFLYKQIEKNITDTVLMGPKNFSQRHPANLNVSFKYVEGESIVLYLDMKGIAVISGSACFSRGLEPSYVITAMGHSHEDAHGSIRFSLGRFNSEEEVIYTIEVLKDVIKTLRDLSPLGGN